jgi:hypothetical protein
MALAPCPRCGAAARRSQVGASTCTSQRKSAIFTLDALMALEVPPSADQVALLRQRVEDHQSHQPVTSLAIGTLADAALPQRPPDRCRAYGCSGPRVSAFADFETSPGPLSVRRRAGVLWIVVGSSSGDTTVSPRKRRVTSIARHPRVCSSSINTMQRDGHRLCGLARSPSPLLVLHRSPVRLDPVLARADSPASHALIEHEQT